MKNLRNMSMGDFENILQYRVWKKVKQKDKSVTGIIP